MRKSFLFYFFEILTLVLSQTLLELDATFFVNDGSISSISDSSYLNVSVGENGYPVIQLHDGLADQVFSALGITDELIPFPGYEDDLKHLEETEDWMPNSDDSLAEEILRKPPTKVRQKRAFMVKEKSLPWPNGQLYYIFDEKYPSALKKGVMEVMGKVQELIPCVQFLPGDPVLLQANIMRSYLVVTDQSSGCMVSRIGYSEKSKRKMVLVNLSRNCFPRVAEHELMHVLGAVHTQNRPDRDNFVELDLNNVQKKFRGQYKKIQSLVHNYDYEYDYDSAMHYGPTAFALDRKKPTIWVKAPNKASLSSPQYMSDKDIESLRDWYGCGKRCPFKSGDCQGIQKQKKIAKSWKGGGARELYVTGGLLIRIKEMLNNSSDVPPNILGYIEKIATLENDRRIKRLKAVDVGPRCVIGRLLYAEDCKKTGLKFKVRQLQIQEKFVQGGIPCPEAKDILSISTCNTQKPERQRSKRETVNQDTVEISRRVDVLEGEDIILAVYNPFNTSVRWFNSSGTEIASTHSLTPPNTLSPRPLNSSSSSLNSLPHTPEIHLHLNTSHSINSSSISPNTYLVNNTDNSHNNSTSSHGNVHHDDGNPSNGNHSNGNHSNSNYDDGNHDLRHHVYISGARNNILQISGASGADNGTTYTTLLSSSDRGDVRVKWEVRVLDRHQIHTTLEEFLLSWMEELTFHVLRDW